MYRVYYEVTTEPERVVAVLAIGIEITNTKLPGRDRIRSHWLSVACLVRNETKSGSAEKSQAMTKIQFKKASGSLSEYAPGPRTP